LGDKSVSVINTTIKYCKLIPLIPRIFYEKIGHKIVDAFDKLEVLKYYLIPVNVNKIKVTIITGCDSSHFKSQVQFFNSLYQHESNIKTIYYDFGISEEQRKLIANNFPCVIIKKFDFDRYPDYFDIKKNAGEYAWKPVAVCNELLMDYNNVVWMDAGNIITGKLNTIRRILYFRGFYSPQSSGNIKEWTHYKMVSYFRISNKIQKKSNLASGIVALNPNFRNALHLAIAWKCFALEKETIAPVGSDRSNHRQDQALLTVLAYKFNMVKGMPKRYYGFDVHKDID
jgi:hypothetical protein